MRESKWLAGKGAAGLFSCTLSLRHGSADSPALKLQENSAQIF